MTIPSPSALVSQTKSAYGQKLGPEAEAFLASLFGAVTDGWKDWQDAIKFGKLTVGGGGVGAWSGTGSGGKMQGGAYTMPDFSFKGNSPQQKKFSKGLGDTLAQKFPAFVTSFTITTAAFTGSSGATATTPGPVNGQNTPAPLMTAGSGTNPSGIAADWSALLTLPDFDLANPQCKSGDLIKAISKAIEQSFKTTWLTTTMLTGNVLSTTGLPGGSVASAITGMDGKLA